MPPKGKSQRKNKKGKGGRGGASSTADRHHEPKKMQDPCDKGDTATASEANGVTSHQADHEPRVERQQLEMPSGAVSAAVASAVAAGYVTPSMQNDSSPIATITSDSQQPKPSSLPTSKTDTIPSGAVDEAVKAAIAAPAVWPILHRYSAPSKLHVATSDDVTTTNTDDQKIKSEPPPPKATTTHDKPPPIPPKSVDAAVDAAIAAPVATQVVETLSSALPSESHESTPPPPLPKEPQQQQQPSSQTEFPKEQRHDVSSSPATPTALKEEETDMTEQSISEAIQTSMVQPPPRSVQAPIPSSQIPSMSPSPPPLPPPPSEYYRQRRQETGRGQQQQQQRQQQQSLCRIL
ncbi:predicted protein [Lichtheimia corymbifera JMRC:FSU:9682]|uniref:Uncharacterized protein n=1 Tax=Lichtheimia corymbifera JMRC:FSU:9682 TaxID=1263082 RepID=A0A068S1C0_9FUNG|nr:predicted protein [Lichtheimia corymbifera JMRC:FSU:9682]